MIDKTLTSYQRSKIDESDDSIFYSSPKLVHHLDYAFRSRLTNLYREKLHQSSIILDLMSSWVTHLPEDISYQNIIGHGLNKEELAANNRLDSYWVQDLNKDQIIPLESNSVDYILITAGWQYLQYPENIASELRRIIRMNGRLIVSFSNRAFWHKTPRVWSEGTDEDHLNYISELLHRHNWIITDLISESTQPIGISRLLGIKGDPFFSVIASPA